LKALNDHTRTTYYVLPLISLNKFSFGTPENFIDAYLTKDLKQVVVSVKDTGLVFPAVWTEAPVEHYTKTEIWLEIPEEFWGDVRNLMKGKYSAFSLTAKDLITQHSGLTYKRNKTAGDGRNMIDTDARLLALTKDKILKDYLEEELGVWLDDESELLSPPTDKEIWKEEESLVAI
jgi:hypothetical protein